LLRPIPRKTHLQGQIEPMAFGISKTKLSPIAIDFGADSIKVMQISYGGSTTQLVGAGTMVIPESSRGDTAARYAFAAEALREILSKQPFKGKRAMCAIPAYQTLVSALELPCGANENLDQQVNLHIQTVLEMDPSRMVVRNHHVGKVMRDGKAKQRVISLAAPRAAIMRYIEIATALKLEVVGMHSEPMCIAKPFVELYNRREVDRGTRCFVDVGAARTKIIILRDGEILMARTLSASGDELTRRHAEEHKLDFTEARLARIREASNPLAARPFPSQSEREKEDNLRQALVTGTVGSGSESDDEFALGLALDQSAPAEAGLIEDRRDESSLPEPSITLEDLDETLDSLVDGMRMAIRYHDSVEPEHPVERVVLLGGESRQRAVSEAVAYALGLPTFVGDPLARVMRTPGVQTMGVDINQPQPGWAVPLGLCLSDANL